MLLHLTLAAVASFVLSATAVRQPPTAPPLKLKAETGEGLSGTLEGGA
jgi:hypothetical protein